MAKIKLLNARIMPQPGFYSLERISREKFIEVFNSGKVDSFIGYKETADHIKELTGIEVPLSRKQTVLEHGDILLICSLKYRIQNPNRKWLGVHPKQGDFEYFLGKYSTETKS